MWLGMPLKAWYTCERLDGGNEIVANLLQIRTWSFIKHTTSKQQKPEDVKIIVFFWSR